MVAGMYSQDGNGHFGCVASAGRRIMPKGEPAPGVAFPELGPTTLITLHFRDILNPQQFEHCVAKEKAPARSPLSGMSVRRTFNQPKLPQSFGGRRANGRADKRWSTITPGI